MQFKSLLSGCKKRKQIKINPTSANVICLEKAPQEQETERRTSLYFKHYFREHPHSEAELNLKIL